MPNQISGLSVTDIASGGTHVCAVKGNQVV